MADLEITVAGLDAELGIQETAIKAALDSGNMDEVNRIVMERAPILAKRARLVLTENKVAIAAETDEFKADLSQYQS